MTKAKKRTAKVWPPGMATNITNETWFYEDLEGLCVVRRLRNPGGGPVQSDMFHLPWNEVAKAVDRMRAAKAKKRSAR